MNLSSLLPYLEQNRGNFLLKFSLMTEQVSIQYPFRVISDSDPLTRIIEAQFLTDTRIDLKRVFLLIQKDYYLLTRDELWPLNNKDIEDSWQKAFSFYSNKGDNNRVITLSHQINQIGELIPFHSLFYCKKNQIFFHPPCPKCGLPIQLCFDDNLLISLGLQAYSMSLKRYLLCPSCISSGGASDLYVYELDTSDPHIVKNRWELIKGFGQLLEKGVQTAYLPCYKCADNRDCYGGTYNESIQMIVPFSFYPFYMLIFEAMSLNASDFLSLISGASVKELETELSGKSEFGRINCLKKIKQDSPIPISFFFEGDERYFLEVLYLKLSFLDALIRNIFSSGGDACKHPDLQLSLDKIWVNLPDTNGLLPFFWDFNVKFIHLMRNPSSTHSFPKFPACHMLHFLGLLWFYTLLVNSKQDISKVYLALGKMINTSDLTNQPLFENINKDKTMPIFLPENIYWNPEGKTITEEWYIFWEKSLNLGCSLLNNKLNHNLEWSNKNFYEQLEALREEIKKTLFREQTVSIQPAYPTEKDDLHMNDEAIHEILMHIFHQWRKEIEQKKPGIPDIKAADKGKEELEATVVISPSASQRKPSAPEIEAADKRKEEELEKTVIISPQGSQRKPSAPYVKTADKGKEAQEIKEDISGFKKELRSKEVTPERREESPQRLDKSSEDIPQKPGTTNEEDFFTETVILSKDTMKQKDPKKNNE